MVGPVFSSPFDAFASRELISPRTSPSLGFQVDEEPNPTAAQPIRLSNRSNLTLDHSLLRCVEAAWVSIASPNPSTTSLS